MKKELIFLGPPACGKGTQTDMLAKEYNLPHVDTGSLLRAEIKKQTPDGILADSFISKGQLVPVELVASIIGSKLAGEDCKNGFILDGYPRSIEQAEKLENIRKNINGENKTDFRAIYFDVDEELLLSRIVNRRSCPQCGKIYNIKYHPPKNENICDECNIKLIQRGDDTEEIAKQRFNTYFEQTAPLVEYYKNQGVLRTINANGSINEVWERLLEAVK